jgi:hypothetical protein
MEFWEHIQDRAKRLQTVDSKTSSRQREKISNDYKAKKERALKSETVKATLQDIKLFGKDKVFRKKEE